MKATRERVAWIDNAKFFAIVCVIIGHSFSLIEGEFRGYNEINLFIVAFNMPLFAMVSGITSYKSLERITSLDELISYFNKISWRVGIPTVIYTLIAMAIGYGMQQRWYRSLISFGLLIFIVSIVYYFKNKNTNNIIIQRIKAILPYLVIPICLINQSVWYFVYLLMALFAAGISSYVAHISDKYHFLIFGLMFLVLSFLIAPLSPFFSLAELYLPFLIGYFYSRRFGLNRIYRSYKLLIVLAIFLLFVGIATFGYYYSISNQFYLLDIVNAYSMNLMNIIWLRQVSAVTLSIAIIFIIQLFSRRYNRIAIIGAMTFGIYTIHSEIIGLYKNFFAPLNFSHVIIDLLYVMMIAFMLLMISVVCVNFIRKSPFLKLLLLGE